MFISSFVIPRSFSLLFVSFISFLLRQTRLYIAVHCFCLNLRFHYFGTNAIRPYYHPTIFCANAILPYRIIFFRIIRTGESHSPFSNLPPVFFIFIIDVFLFSNVPHALWLNYNLPILLFCNSILRLCRYCGCCFTLFLFQQII